MFAPYFPPRRRVGAIRSFRFAAHLSARGWKVKVVCLNTPGEKLTVSEREALQDVEILRIGSPVDRTANKGNPSSQKQAKGSGGLAEWFDRQFPVDTWYPLFLYHRKKILTEIRAFDPDVLWSTADPWSSNVFMAGIQKKLNKPWVADQRDPWTLCDIRFSRNGPLARFVARKAENMIMQRADHIVFTAEETTKKYRQAYPSIKSKVSTIYNSFVKPDRSEPEESHKEKEYFRLIFLGQFRPLSSADAIIRVLSEIRERNPDILHKLRVISYGPLTAEDHDKAQAAGVLGCFESRERVPNEQVPGEIAGADMLLLSTEMERDDIIPAKLIDYLPYDTPILALNESPEVRRIIEESGSGYVFGREHYAEAADLLAEHITELRKGSSRLTDSEASEAILKRFRIDYTTEQLDMILREVIPHG